MIRRMLVFIALPVLYIFAETPRIPITLNFERGSDETQWSVVTKQYNTPVIRCYTYQGTSAWSSLGWNCYFKYAKNDGSTNVATITGTSYTNYIDFQVGSNDFPKAMEQWYCTVLMTTGTLQISQGNGLLSVERSPELTAGDLVFGPWVITWSKYTFVGTDTNGPLLAGTNVCYTSYGSNGQFRINVSTNASSNWSHYVALSLVDMNLQNMTNAGTISANSMCTSNLYVNGTNFYTHLSYYTNAVWQNLTNFVWITSNHLAGVDTAISNLVVATSNAVTNAIWVTSNQLAGVDTAISNLYNSGTNTLWERTTNFVFTTSNYLSGVDTVLSNYFTGVDTALSNLIGVTSGQLVSVDTALSNLIGVTSGQLVSVDTALSNLVNVTSNAMTNFVWITSNQLSGVDTVLSNYFSGVDTALSNLIGVTSGQLVSVDIALSNLIVVTSGQLVNVDTAISNQMGNVSNALRQDLTNFIYITSNQLSGVDTALSNYFVGVDTALSNLIGVTSGQLVNVDIALSNLIGVTSGQLVSVDTALSNLLNVTSGLLVNTDTAISNLVDGLEATTNQVFWLDGRYAGNRSVWGLSLSIDNISSASHGSMQAGTNGGGIMRITGLSFGSHQHGYVNVAGEATMTNSPASIQAVNIVGGTAIMNTAVGSMQVGYLQNGAVASNYNASGSLQLFKLIAGETNIMRGDASIGLGAVTVSNNQAIVGGTGNQSHGDGSITMDSFWQGETNLETKISVATQSVIHADGTVAWTGNQNAGGKTATNIASITFVTNLVTMFTGDIGGTNAVGFTCGGTNYWITMD